MSQLNYYNHSENCHSQEYNNLIRAFVTITEGVLLAYASPRLVPHKQIMYRHPNLMHLLILHVASWIQIH